MTASVDLSPYGAHRPGRLVGAMMALTRRLPANRLGLRLSMPLRRIAIDWLGDRPVDTTLWQARVRLYPSRNSCEKDALFTPQLFDVPERTLLGAAMDRRPAENQPFNFVDVGANVGLYSLFIAGRGARCLAIEPQPGILERLRFNLAANPGLPVTVVASAIADRDGEMEMVINSRDNGGSHLRMDGAPIEGAETVRVRCRPLLAILAEAGLSRIDAMKIDIEGAEHLALLPLLQEGPQELLPRQILLEERPFDWPVDLYGALAERGYRQLGRGKVNVVFGLA
jgi:FkbM family methyltransferase